MESSSPEVPSNRAHLGARLNSFRNFKEYSFEQFTVLIGQERIMLGRGHIAVFKLSSVPGIALYPHHCTTVVGKRC